MSTEWNARTARQVRRELGNLYDQTISQIQLAAWLGYSRSAIQNWETDKAVPEPAMRFLYSKLLEDPAYITEIRQFHKTGAESDASQHKAGQTATS
tara:strand:- start:82 stop:369 length:288 start_codon:yes stop_codon:yes gene_type:complete